MGEADYIKPPSEPTEVEFKVTSERAWRDIEECLNEYEIPASSLLRVLIKKVWDHKEKLYSSLSDAQLNNFAHDGEHTNYAVSFLARALVGYRRALSNSLYPQIRWIDQIEVVSLIIDMLGHDWGYLKEGQEGLEIDLTSGHEARSITKLRLFVGQAEGINLLPEQQQFLVRNFALINATSLSFGIGERELSLLNFSNRAFLKYADLCSWLAVNPADYQRRQERLFKELKEAARVNGTDFPYSNFEQFYYSLPNGCPLSRLTFVEQIKQKLGPFLTIIEWYYEFGGGRFNPVREAIIQNITPIESELRRRRSEIKN